MAALRHAARSADPEQKLCTFRFFNQALRCRTGPRKPTGWPKVEDSAKEEVYKEPFPPWVSSATRSHLHAEDLPWDFRMLWIKDAS